MDEKEKNIVPTPEITQPPVETGPTTAPEAPQSQEQTQASSEGTSVDAAQEPSSVPTEAVLIEQKPVEAEKPVKKSHKGLVIGIIVVLVLVIGVVVAWAMLSNRGEEKSEVADNSEVEKPASGGSLRPISTKPDYGGNNSASVEVDLNSLEFHNAFDGFANSMLIRQWLSGRMWYSSLLPSLPDGKVTASDITDEIALSWALDTTPEFACGGLVEKLRPLALQQIENSLNRVITDPNSVSSEQREQIKRDFEELINRDSWLRGSETCYIGESLRTRAWEMFDRGVNLEDGDMIISGIFGSQHMYAADLDVFYAWPFEGGGNGPRPIYIPYEAKKDDERMYVKAAEMYCYKEYTEEDCSTSYVNNHADEVVARHNWILKRASDGRYVFESVERMK